MDDVGRADLPVTTAQDGGIVDQVDGELTAPYRSLDGSIDAGRPRWKPWAKSTP
jgi:hypothetical protein